MTELWILLKPVVFSVSGLLFFTFLHGLLKRKKPEKPKQTYQVQEPQPGSTAHYEKWRAEKLAEQNKEP